MTRASIAETTITRQIHHFESRQRDVLHQIALLNAQVDTYNHAILDLNSELARLRTQRTTASERNKP